MVKVKFISHGDDAFRVKTIYQSWKFIRIIASQWRIYVCWLIG